LKEEVPREQLKEAKTDYVADRDL